MVAFLVALLGSILMGCSLGSPDLPAGHASQPDIVLVSIDTLRADHLSSYGHDRPTSPFLDSLAAAGTRFDHARSTSPWTLPAHITMLTGQLPLTHRVSDDHQSLDPSVPVLPEVLQRAGYKTGASVATLYVSRKFGFERGFDFFDDHGIETEKQNLSGEVIAAEVIDSGLKWIGSLKPGEPAFLFLHFYDVHYHYDPPAPYDTMFDRAPAKGDRRFKNYARHKKHPLSARQKAHQLAQYDESIAYVDGELKRLHAALESAGRRQRWVVTSDHGEEFGERGSWGHAHTLYAEQLRVPLIVSGDGLVENKVIKEAVGIHDIASTIAAWADQPMEAGDGIDLNLAMNGAPVPSRPFPAETFRFKTRRISLYEDGMRLEWDLRKNRKQLYASDSDRLEEKNLAKIRKDATAEMAARAEAVFGRPWSAAAEGTVVASEGAKVLRNGPKSRKTVAAGDLFQVIPYDGEVSFIPAGQTQGSGPWRAATGKTPEEGAPLQYSDTTAQSGVVLDEQTRKQLEALGYIQGEE